MGYFPITAVGKTLVSQSTTSALRQTGLGVSATADAILDDANNAAVLTTLGISAFAQTVLDDADASAVRDTTGSDVGFITQAKTADFTAADHYIYEIDSSGAPIAVTMPDCTANAAIQFKLVTAGNTVTLTRAGTDTIDGATTLAIVTAGEAYYTRADADNNNWMLI